MSAASGSESSSVGDGESPSSLPESSVESSGESSSLESLRAASLSPIRELPLLRSRLRLGLCCINNELRGRGIYCSRKPRLSTIKSRGLSYLREQSLLNCEDLKRLIIWNEQNGIKVLRISSDLFPHYKNRELPDYMDIEYAREKLSEIGELARMYNHRLTFHPGQYNVIGTLDERIFENTLDCLDMHAEILDMLNCDRHSIMVIHGGGVYGNKLETLKRWERNYYRLPIRVQSRLVLENCEKSFSIEDCLYLSDRLNIPVVFDTHHHECYMKLHPSERLQSGAYYIPAILRSWKLRDIRPKFHVSEQDDSKQLGAHSEYVLSLPSYLLNISEPIDIMIEAKGKEKAVAYLSKLYNL